ncbi:MAG TPA: hypothetical protein VI139_05830 [Gemmatimonadales bacterium]
MGKINWGRVLGGGLLAGVVLNVWDFLINGIWLKNDWNTAMHALGKGDMAGSQILWFVLCDFIVGIWLVWLYAAIRPRYGMGPKTAAMGAFGFWFVTLWFRLAEVGMGLFSMNLVVMSAIATLVGMLLAASAGAWQYKEGM